MPSATARSLSAIRKAIRGYSAWAVVEERLEQGILMERIVCLTEDRAAARVERKIHEDRIAGWTRIVGVSVRRARAGEEIGKKVRPENCWDRWFRRGSSR